MLAETSATKSIIELKFGQVGIANLRLFACDASQLRSELEQKVSAAPNLFRRAPLVLDLSRLPELPSADEIAQLLEAARAAGMLPVGLSYGTTENEERAQTLNLPLFAKFRAGYERADASASVRDAEPAKAVAKESAKETRAAQTGMHHTKPVRSGQQIYARGRDLIVNAAVGNGAEVIADGSIHVYGRLSGRALAGAQGDVTARIYCMDFQAELVSIAGQYRVFEDMPTELRGKPVQAWLDGDRLLLAALVG